MHVLTLTCTAALFFDQCFVFVFYFSKESPDYAAYQRLKICSRMA